MSQTSWKDQIKKKWGPHSHCPVCGKAMPSDKQITHEKKQKKKNRIQMIVLFGVMGVMFIFMIFLPSG